MTREEKKITDPKIVTDSVDVAEEAGLRYVSDDQRGYTREAKGDDFEYFDIEGKPIRDEQRHSEDDWRKIGTGAAIS
jgi:DNA topoisomerase IB